MEASLEFESIAQRKLPAAVFAVIAGSIHLEINHATAFDQAQTFSALLDELVKFLCLFDEPEASIAAISIMLLPEYILQGIPPDPPIP